MAKVKMIIGGLEDQIVEVEKDSNLHKKLLLTGWEEVSE